MKKAAYLLLILCLACFAAAANVYVDSGFSGSEGNGSSWSSPIKAENTLNAKLAALAFNEDNYIYIKSLTGVMIDVLSGPQSLGTGLYFIGCDSNGDRITTIGEYATCTPSWNNPVFYLAGSFHSVFVENLYIAGQTGTKSYILAALDVSCKGFHFRNCQLGVASYGIYTPDIETMGSLSVEDCVFGSDVGIRLAQHATKNRTLFVKNSLFLSSILGIGFGRGTLMAQNNVFNGDGTSAKGIQYSSDTHAIIEHNTFYKCAIAIEGTSGDQKAVVVNYNLFASCNADFLIVKNLVTPRYNVTTRNTTVFSDLTNQKSVSLASIGFTDAANGDFSLAQTSIALDVDSSTSRGGRTAGAWQPASDYTGGTGSASGGKKGKIYKSLY